MDPTNCLIGEPLADHTPQRRSGAAFIVHAKSDAVVIAEIVFAEIAVQVLFATVLENALHAALMRGVYQHCSEKHLHRHLVEYGFRFNHREALGYSDEARTIAAVKSAEGKRLTYHQSN